MVPKSWHRAIVMLLHKKGDQKDLANYRPISLLSALYKLFTKIITNRISRQLDENQPREQAGFRSGFSTMDHLQAMHQLIEKTSEYNMQLCLAFVDYRKAFDSIEIPAMLEAIECHGVDQTYVNILKHIYQNASSFIRLHKDSEPFKLKKRGQTGRLHFTQALHCLPRASVPKIGLGGTRDKSGWRDFQQPQIR